PCHRADRRTGLQPGPRRETCGPADGGAERLDGATHFLAGTSACTGSTFTGTGRASGSDSLRFLKFRQRSMPLWDFRFFVVSSYLITTNTREVGLVLTILNHFHLFPSGPLAQSAEGARRGHLLCSTEYKPMADFAQVVLGGAALGGEGVLP